MMNVKRTLVSVILSASIVLIVLVNFSCTKSSSTTVVTTSTIYANIDSMTGYYAGITSGDSLYSYTDSNGKPQQWIHSFSWPDTLYVSAPDTVHISVASKYYTTSFPYGDSLTVVYINSLTDSIAVTTVLQNLISGQQSVFNDSANGVNHLIVSVANSYVKSVTSNVKLYKRQ